ncbi:MAG: T9SS type A sorting domain-containing protein [Bacteroidales bacterium]
MKYFLSLLAILIFSFEIYSQTTTLTNINNSNLILLDTTIGKSIKSGRSAFATKSLIDAGVISILTPTANAMCGDFDTVTVLIKNFGTDTLHSIPVRYQIGSGNIVTTTFTGSLLPDSITTLSFLHLLQTNNQNYTIRVFTSLLNDSDTLNDTIYKYVTVGPALNDVSITEKLLPGPYVSYNQSSTFIKIVIKNCGTLPQTSITLSYQRNNNPPVNAIWTGNLPPGDTVHFTFPNPMILPSSPSFSLCVYTNLSNDVYRHNDTICKSVALCTVFMAGTITGPTNVSYGGTYTYTIPAILNATSYNWVYFPNTGVTIVNNGTSANITFGAGSITYGLLSVNGFNFNSNCSGIPSTLAFPDGVGELETQKFWLGQNIPNPASDVTNIEYFLPSLGEIQFTIMNLYGQKVYSSNKKSQAGKNEIDVNVKDLSAGIYYYTIEFKGNRLVKKMVVSK